MTVSPFDAIRLSYKHDNMTSNIGGGEMRRNADILGWRAKVGVLVPATNTVCQPECEAMRPAGVTNHVARMQPSDRGKDLESYRASLARGPEHVKAAMVDLMRCEPDILLLGHSIDTFRGGMKGAEAMKRDLETACAGVPMILPSHAFAAGLKAMGAGRRIAALTPYFPPGDEQVVEFFQSAGYEIVKLIGLKCQGPLAIASTPVADVVEALKALAREDVDLIIQPGTNLPTGSMAAEAERWIGKPLLACNAVTYWHTLRTLGIADRMDGFGPLLSRH
jgi:maleate isomerase